MKDQEEMSPAEQNFNKIFQRCKETLKMASGQEEENLKSLQESKALLKELEGVVEEIERDASLATVDRKIKEAAAKGYRNEYHSLVRQIMKLDSQTTLEKPANASYRFTSDMISEDAVVANSTNSYNVPSYNTEDLEESPEELNEMRQTTNLEKKLIIGSFFILLIFLIILLLVIFFR